MELSVAAGLHSRAAMLAMLVAGLAAGWYLAPKVDLTPVLALLG